MYVNILILNTFMHYFEFAFCNIMQILEHCRRRSRTPTNGCLTWGKLCMYIALYLSIFIYLSFYLSIFIYLSSYLSIYLSIYLSLSCGRDWLIGRLMVNRGIICHIRALLVHICTSQTTQLRPNYFLWERRCSIDDFVRLGPSVTFWSNVGVW